MSRNLNDKKRVLDICKLREKLAQVDHRRAQKNIAELEVSGQQLGMMVGQMLDISGYIHAAILSAKLEFGHRLITLQNSQKKKITHEQSITAVLQSWAFQCAQTAERADLNFRKAKKSDENNRFRDLPIQIKNLCSPEGRSRKDMTT